MRVTPCAASRLSQARSKGEALKEAGNTRPLLPGVPRLGNGPHVQLWPHRHGTDAMFLAAFRG